jgi:large subunit ribosomal protein L24e
MPKCSFCGINIARGTGKMFVRKDGRIYNFCSSKCENNQLVLRRRSRSVKWTADARKAKEERKHANEASAPAKKSTATKKK